MFQPESQSIHFICFLIFTSSFKENIFRNGKILSAGKSTDTKQEKISFE